MQAADWRRWVIVTEFYKNQFLKLISFLIINSKLQIMPIIIVAVGNGGYNFASDIKNAKLFMDAKLIVCDTDDKELADNAA